MSTIAPAPTLADIDQRLDAVREQILAHLNGRPVTASWQACWRAIDTLLDQRIQLGGTT